MRLLGIAKLWKMKLLLKSWLCSKIVFKVFNEHSNTDNQCTCFNCG